MFRIASNQFGYLMFFMPCGGGDSPVTDRIEQVAPYDHRDNRWVKLNYWRGYAKSQGLDPKCVQIVPVEEKDSNGFTKYDLDAVPSEC